MPAKSSQLKQSASKVKVKPTVIPPKSNKSLISLVFFVVGVGTIVASLYLLWINWQLQKTLETTIASSRVDKAKTDITEQNIYSGSFFEFNYPQTLEIGQSSKTNVFYL